MKQPLKRRYIEIEEEEPPGNQTHLNASFDTICFSDDDDELSDDTACYSEEEYYSDMPAKRHHFQSGAAESRFTEAVSFVQFHVQNNVLHVDLDLKASSVPVVLT